MSSTHIELSGSLEDYLETVFQLVQTAKVARVKDIAKARDVKPGSVSQALKRLAELGLVDYVQREYVALTERGERQARRVYAKHKLLTRFFGELLQMSEEAAETEACAIEHALSAEGMDRLVRFFEFLAACPMAPASFLEQFANCKLMHSDDPGCHSECAGCQNRAPRPMSLAELEVGQTASVVRLIATDVIRQRLLGLGLLPDTTIRVQRRASDGLWIDIGEQNIRLSPAEAESIRVLVQS